MPTTTEVEKATKTLNALLDTRDQLIGRAAKLSADRQAVAYAAHTGDKAAKERLRKINDETVLHNAEIESVDAAIAEANARLAAAKDAEAQVADRANAEQLRIKASRLVELALIVDDAFADVISASTEMKEVLSEMHNLGCASPSHDQLRVMAVLVAKSAVMQIPFCAREWEYLAPNQRKTFKSIVSGWHAQVASNIAARLGEQKEVA
jgi:hypothetical protein